ncbi:MAG: hypothetical protein AAFX58_06700 [Pseudomonadota bacterium]
MSAAVRATAPGKLFVSGEYAVLDGAPAIGFALAERVAAELVPASAWVLHAPGVATQPIDFDVAGDGTVSAPGRPPALRILTAALDSLRASGHALPGPQAVTLDTTALYRDDRKLGLGSSAALSAALAGALAALVDAAPEALAADIHGRLQPRGSGADLAVVLNGGVVRCQRRAGAVEAVPCAWPEGLGCRGIDTGRAASTPAMLARLDAWRAGSADVFAALAPAAEAAAAAWGSGDAAASVQALDAFSAELSVFDAMGRIGIFAGGHAPLRHLATRHRVAYKPSGAGGGDIGLAFAEDAAALDAFVAAARRGGWYEFVVEPAATGLSVT